ncbi:TetR/AcrR family transcriptional regulator [Agrococcus sp. SL85]|uniref:TetR/AcrR family transcriptional regulator n=1 Tax=Agrococcus sp. SL85 TaxID=2995141 RepID=UPI00226CB811|nr:TetR/AcrR family transcriptional regulator [Agrococcus sp. SL85]WAC65316.1 TetR/AcrR family transcriptional regulator [Agrococcus sp. SL85]
MPTPSDAPPPARRASAKGIARRQEILDRALEVFARRGSERTSLRAIAREVGVTHAALTHYFASLEELLVAVYRESERRLDEAGPAAHAATPVEAMRVSAQQNRAVPGLVQLYTSLVAAALEADRPAATAFVADRFERLRAGMAEQVRENQRAGLVRDDVDPEHVAALVIAASDGLQTQWLLDGEVALDGSLALLEHLLRPDR